MTNVPEEIADPKELILLYRLRWKIELVFKLWKSYAKLNVIGDWRIEREAVSILYGVTRSSSVSLVGTGQLTGN